MRHGRKITGLFISVFLLAIPVVLFINQQALADWLQLRSYEPPTRIAALAQDTSMTDEGKKLFYVNDPQLLDKSRFRTNCSDTEHSIVLGCYRSGDGIYLLDVTDPRLAGIIEVTAVHEMLHVAYERLSDGEREEIDRLTLALKDTLTDERVKETIAQYESKGTRVIADEIHSIFATELASLPEELELYYKRYVSNRQKVVGYSNQYANEFTSRQKQLNVYKMQLQSLKSEIDSLEKSLQQRAVVLANNRQELDAKLENGDYEAYNAAVLDFNSSVRAYNDSLAIYRQKINDYNRLVQSYNDIANQERELVEAIDSRLDEQTTQ